MNKFERFMGVCVIGVGVVLLVQHGRAAMNPALPKDMPAQSQFMPGEFDVAHLEAKGDWVACGVDQEQGQDWCRVTDVKGQVVYQGDFLPVTSEKPLPRADLKVSQANVERLWVQGPARSGPVPVIRLASGTLLVPAADRAAFADRWSSHPEELAALSPGN